MTMDEAGCLFVLVLYNIKKCILYNKRIKRDREKKNTTSDLISRNMLELGK